MDDWGNDNDQDVKKKAKDPDADEAELDEDALDDILGDSETEEDEGM